MPRGRPRKGTTTVQKLTVVPPTKRQTEQVLFQLRQGRWLEHACLLAGVSLRVLHKWIELGRKNTPGYVEFTDAIDRVDAELGDKLMTGVMSAIQDGDISSLRWLYDKRFAQREKHVQSKFLTQEDDLSQQQDEAGEVDVMSLEQAEQDLEAALLADEGELH